MSSIPTKIIFYNIIIHLDVFTHSFARVSMKLDYSPAANDQFFSQVLSCPLRPCSFDVYMNLTEDAANISIHTIGPQLVISGYAFPGSAIEHILHFNTDYSTQTPSITINSNVIGNDIVLNPFMLLKQPQNRSLSSIQADYWRDGSIEGYLANVSFSLFGTGFTAPVSINNYGLSFHANALLFDLYKANLIGNSPPDSTFDDFTLNIDGAFLNGPDSFVNNLEHYIYNYVRTKYMQSQERITNAQAEINHITSLIQQYNQTLAEYQMNLTALSLIQNIALNKVIESAAFVHTTQMSLNASVQQTLSDILSACENINCPNMCLPRALCQSCDNHLTLGERGTKYAGSVRTKQLQNKEQIVTEKKWHTENTCRTTINIKGWGETTFGQTCSYKTVSGNVTQEKQVTYYDWVNMSQIQVSEIDDHPYTVEQVCCSENCDIQIMNFSCAINNAGCRIAQKPAIDVLTEAEKALVEPVLQLYQANMNLSIAKTELALIEAKYSVLEIQYNKTSAKLVKLLKQLKASNNALMAIQGEVSPFLEIVQVLESNSIQQLLLKNISFFVAVMETSPTKFPIDILCSIPSHDTTLTITIETDFSSTEPILFRFIADNVLMDLIQYFENVGAKQRRSVFQPSYNHQQFMEKCASLKIVKMFLNELNQSLEFVLLKSNEALHNVTLVAERISNITSMEPLEFPHINFTFLNETYQYVIDEDDLFLEAKNDSSIKDLTWLFSELQKWTLLLTTSVSHNLFSSWQHGIMSVYGKFGLKNIANQSCYSFTDCLTTVGNIVHDLVIDTEINQSSLLTALPSAKQSLLQLSLSNDISIPEASSHINKMYDIITAIDNSNYWCGGLPVITQHPMSISYVEVNTLLNLSCAAQSTVQPLTYSWRKDGFVLPYSTTSNLIINITTLLDEGQYQCTASNAIGTVESHLAEVYIYTPPAIVLSPSNYATFEGSDNGGWFACNATGHPLPGYQWYYRSPNTSQWVAVKSSDSNELVVHKPTSQDEGWYKCEAFIGNTSVYSQAAYLTVYAASFSTLKVPMELLMIILHPLPKITNQYEEGLKELLRLNIASYIEDNKVKVTDIVTLFGYNNVTVHVLVTFALSYHHNYSKSQLISDQATGALANKDTFMTNLVKFETKLQQKTLYFDYKNSTYASIGLLLEIGELIYDCPNGRGLQYANFLCSKLYNL